MICEIAGYERKSSVRSRSQEEERWTWHSSNMVNLCLDTWNEKKQNGRLYHIYTKEPIAFSSLFEAVNRMEELYDTLSFPESGTVLRDFLTGRREKAMDNGQVQKKMQELETFEHVICQKGVKATFFIRVMYRQHCSWQGEVTWLERQKKEHFRSVLELFRLLDSALRIDNKGTK